MKKILITGASGLLGINFALTAQSLGYEIAGVTLESDIGRTPFELSCMDLTLPGSIQKQIEDQKPQVIINCVALTNVDQCEKSPEAAERVNAALPGELAYETARRNIKLVQISTDAVFNGKCGGYVEEDPVSPTNVYAATKLAGEKAVMAEDSEALVCRVVFYGWSISGTRSLAEWFFNKLSTGEATRGFSDVIFSPLLATDLAAIILKLVEHDESGLFHVVNPQSISKYDFGQILARQFGFDHSLISPASIMDAGLIATRSPNLNLKPDKLLSTLGEDLPDQKTEMSRFHQQYVDGYPSLLKSFNMK